jgi:hypothetical protein
VVKKINIVKARKFKFSHNQSRNCINNSVYLTK